MAGSSSIVSGIAAKSIAENRMIDLHPEILTKNGKREFVVLPYEEFVALQELLADAEDLRELRAAKAEEATAPAVPLAEVKRRLGMA